MLSNAVYFITFIVSSVWIIEVLKKSQFEKAFKPNSIWHIRSFYIILALIGAHLLASMVERVFNLF
ncbi:hypothetical protein P5915_04060 [Acholeplasma manati]|jgi:hypothetical protein|nr:hypothetical protein [Paracholeplasma manati]MDX9808386.1 hypothetical protein [Acholeplasma sp.]